MSQDVVGWVRCGSAASTHSRAAGKKQSIFGLTRSLAPSIHGTPDFFLALCHTALAKVGAHKQRLRADPGRRCMAGPTATGQLLLCGLLTSLDINGSHHRPTRALGSSREIRSVPLPRCRACLRAPIRRKFRGRGEHGTGHARPPSAREGSSVNGSLPLPFPPRLAQGGGSSGVPWALDVRHTPQQPRCPLRRRRSSRLPPPPPHVNR